MDNYKKDGSFEFKITWTRMLKSSNMSSIYVDDRFGKRVAVLLFGPSA